MLFQCWFSVVDAGLTLKQHCVNVSCLLESDYGVSTQVGSINVEPHLVELMSSRW